MLQRFADFRPEAEHILCGKVATLETVEFNQAFCHFSFIEEPLTLVSKGLQRVGQLRLTQQFTFGAKPVLLFATAIDASCFLCSNVDRGNDAEDIGLQGIGGDSVPGVTDSRFHQSLHREGTELPVDIEETAYGTGCRDGTGADMELLLRSTEIGDDRMEIDLVDRALAPGGLDEKVEQPGFA